MSSVVGVLADHEADHERGVEDLAEAELLEDVALDAEAVDGLDFARRAEPTRSCGRPMKRSSISLAVEEGREGLEGAEVAAGVIADADFDAAQVVRGAGG